MFFNKKDNKKSQASMELMILLGLLLVVFLFVVFFSNSVFYSITVGKLRIHASEIAEDVAWKINQVYRSGEGTSLDIILPENLPGVIPYDLFVHSDARLVEVVWQGRHYTVPIVTSNITGVLAPSPGNLTITYEDGGINLAQ